MGWVVGIDLPIRVLEALLVHACVRLEVLFEQAVERGALGVFG